MSDPLIPKSERTNLVAKLRAALASGDSGRITAVRREMDEDDARWDSATFNSPQPHSETS